MNAVIISTGWWKNKEIENSIFFELSKGESRLIILDDSDNKYTESELLDVWKQVKNKMPVIDKVLIVNPDDFQSSGCAWKMGKKLGISRDQAVFVFCKCTFDWKKESVEDAGFDPSDRMSTRLNSS